MNSVLITQRLKQALVDYLSTTFNANKDGKEPELAERIKESFEYPQALFAGPYLELILPYKKSKSILDLCKEGVLSKQLTELSCFHLDDPEPIPLNTPLYLHQERSIRKLCVENKGIVISSGTGSGKTECFTIPIVNDLLIDDTPGVRALLVYPLNALVNDQLERLRVMLKETSITFGRFTSELPNQERRDSRFMPNEVICREEIRTGKKIPQILITNYAMLEYLLLRPEDNALFSDGLWKFLVLDEAHTYSGAQGIEVAMLIRRLKQRLGKERGELLTIATSATLVNDNPEEAAKFASNLFDEEIQIDNVIFGDKECNYLDESDDQDSGIIPETYLHQDFDILLEEIRKGILGEEESVLQSADIETIALRMVEIGLINTKDLELVDQHEDDLSGFLYKVLSRNSEIIKLRNWMIDQDKPVLFDDAAKLIFPNLDQMEQAIALYRLIEICSFARPASNLLPLLPAKYHLFARPPQGIWACINPNCVGKNTSIDSHWSRLYSNPTVHCESCGAQVYPVHLCRECGQVFLAFYQSKYDNKYYPASDQLFEDVEKRYLTWSKIEVNETLADSTDEVDYEDSENLGSSSSQNKYSQNELRICLNCGKKISQCDCENQITSVPLYNIVEKTKKRKGKETYEQEAPVADLRQCPRCLSQAKAETEIVTPITIKGLAPLANLTYELYRQLPPARDPKKKSVPGEGRKLLTFYDSRQGAARFAAFLQDVSIKQNYRHIIPKAIEESKMADEWGEGSSPNLIALSQKCGEIAWSKGLIQNDSDSEYWRGGSWATQTPDQRKKASIWMSRIILGEFTTGRRARQSLESMGLVGVSYFDHFSPDFSSLCNKTGLTVEQVSTLINFLLDDLRYIKAVELPTGVYAKDPEFGPNQGNPRVIRQGKPNYGELRWIGATERQFRRQYVQRALEAIGANASMENVVNVLTEIWDWLIYEGKGLFVGTATDGYRLDPRFIFLDTKQKWYMCTNCLRLSYRGASLPCPHPLCGGKLEPVDINLTQEQNYFYKLFQQPVIPIRVEEHTAQLDPDKGRDYQNLFKDGHINALSCSTTFEMGIDLGDLQAVTMNNVPPTVANYRQRAGRAGRRTSGTAFILTWASDRPHDQAYYDEPPEIISGKVNVPSLMLENEMILRRHVNAILLSQFLRYRKRNGIEPTKLTFSGDFFDYDSSQNPHYAFLEDWVKEERGAIDRHLTNYAEMLPNNVKSIVLDGLQHFLTDLRRINEEHYQPITSYYREQIREIAKQIADTSMSHQAGNKLESQIRLYRNLLNRIRGSEGKKVGYLIDYLSSNGVLPSYSFPLHTVELILPVEERLKEHLRLERDLRQAIKEYAPGSEIVADKKIWRSLRPVFWKDTPKVLEYRICEHCHHLEVSSDAGIPLPQSDGTCSVCSNAFTSKSRVRKFVEPDGFVADPKSGKAAKQYVKVEQNQMRSALIPEHNTEEEKFSDNIYLSYNQKGKLLYVNEGKYGAGFQFPIEAFSLLSEKGALERLSLGYIQNTNTLHIRFSGDESIAIPSPHDQSFWLSLLYAIIHGACHSLQIERRDIDGVLFPRSSAGSWEQTIVLYDNVPGGAGHVKAIKDNLTHVLDEASRVLSCNDCAPNTSCNHCLRDYNNQYHYQLLKREHAQNFLEDLRASISPLDIGVQGSFRVIAPNTTFWLYEKIRYAKQSLDLALPYLCSRHPLGENFTWLDTLGDLINKGIKINLYLQLLPTQTPTDYSMAKHLQVLIEKGLSVWKISSLPRWQIVIDENYSEPRMIGDEREEEYIVLGDETDISHLISSTCLGAVQQAGINLQHLKRNKIHTSELNAPDNTTVVNLRSSVNSGITESSLFDPVFSKPIRKLLVHDPYLHDRERIVNRMGQYISMASRHESLEEVVVHTKRAPNQREQDLAIQELKSRFNFPIRFKFSAEHDRYIEILRNSGEKAIILIGRGLDFIQPDGSIKSTFIVIQDPVTE